MEKIMYDAQPNSPITYITSNITNVDTTVQIEDVSVLPPAPNLMTIGFGELSETVRYTSINGKTLTIERAIQGTQRAWPSGELVGRVYTAYDHSAFKENIEHIDDRTKPLDMGFNYNLDGTINVITTAEGTKTFAYNIDGTVNTITGTGIYPTKTFAYNEDGSLSDIIVT
jgi:hypothetical protein